MNSSSLRRVAPLLFSSGACALIYQVAWFRELRLIFGASTASSAAVLAVFMGGLGIGGMVLGKRADRVDNPLDLYARLEGGVAVTAAITPLLVRLAQSVYLGVGGAAVLGGVGATIVRLLLSVIVLGLPAVLMGGTLPAMARAVGQASDSGRQRVATLYGVNTFGAVVGTLAANFVLVEVFGTRLTLWLACLVNVLVAMAARVMARSTPRKATKAAAASTTEAAESAAELSRAQRWFPPFAAGVSGLAFMLMELVWYRMLAPLLGGSSYTFGLILALALVGIGIGGLAYSRTKRPPTFSGFAVTCALEALALVVPYALGDRLAVLAALLRPLARVSFAGSIATWTVIAGIVVLPAAIVSGYQFPLVIGLYGRGVKNIGRHVGHAYLANTVGSILGSIGGGFGLLPLLSAPRCWQAVAVLLLVTACLGAALDIRSRRLSLEALVSVLIALPSCFLLTATGPTHAWRHSGIGAGRSDLDSKVSREAVEKFIVTARSAVVWEVDGLESSVALGRENGHVFIVNGKADGNIIGDAGTQVMSGLLAALLHPSTTRALVIGLGTGSTAGWLGAIPSIEKVDVVELEPAILRVARDCGAANMNVLDNPKVHITLGDAREVLRTTRQRYDIVFSEPSNPYRAGISSLYTEEFYRAAAERLDDGGLFVQWIQTYEIDALAVTTAAVTLHQVFPNINLWETTHGDLLLVGSKSRAPIDVQRIRDRLSVEPYRTAARAVWKTTSAEGVLAHFVAGPAFVDMLADQRLGLINTDDQNFLEFAFARNVGNRQVVATELHQLVARLGFDQPDTVGTFDPSLLGEEQVMAKVLYKIPISPGRGAPPALTAFARSMWHLHNDDFAGGLAAWSALNRTPRSHHEAMLVASAAALTGDERAESLVPDGSTAAERDLLRAHSLLRKNMRDQAVDHFERGFVGARKDPWIHIPTMLVSLRAAVQLADRDPAVARRFTLAVSEPFAVDSFRSARVDAYLRLARLTDDPKLCVGAVDSNEPLPMGHLFYETRVFCYRQANDARLPAAEEEFAHLLSFTRPFGADIPTPPSAKKNGPPPIPEGAWDAAAPPLEDLSFGLDAGSGAESASP